MNQPRHPLRINVGFLINQAIGTSRDIHFEYPQLELPPDFELSDFSGLVRINRTPQGLLFQGEFSAKTLQQCKRCLVDFLQPLKAGFNELYAFHGRAVTDLELVLPEDANVDLDPLVREYLLLEVPIAPVCKPDCKGLCPVCGEDLNAGLCEHAQMENAGKKA